tara:strand:- start:71 stop:349 length:279 start_codon:yes stop_codon:yes gene_type:complete
MELQNRKLLQSSERRNRIHELLIALINQQQDLELMDEEAPTLEQGGRVNNMDDPASWLNRNRRILKKYQALVRSAITLETLLDAEEGAEETH